MTGKVKSEKMNDFNKDLEFNELIDKFTYRIMMAWNIPNSRLPFVNLPIKSSTDSNEGYYKKINRIQKEIEEKLKIYREGEE